MHIFFIYVTTGDRKAYKSQDLTKCVDRTTLFFKLKAYIDFKGEFIIWYWKKRGEKVNY